jgi:DNA-binding transcriptional regulator PaaX
MPGLPIAIKPFMDEKRKRDEKEWEKYNLSRLRKLIKRLETQKVVEIVGEEVRITNKGRQRILKYNLEDMELKKITDGKWRVIIYDVANLKKYQRDIFRRMLVKLKFLRIQESVYLTPLVCDKEIEYLREMFNVGKEVLVLKVKEIENEQVYKKYFGI